MAGQALASDVNPVEMLTTLIIELEGSHLQELAEQFRSLPLQDRSSRRQQAGTNVGPLGITCDSRVAIGMRLPGEQKCTLASVPTNYLAK